MVIGAPLENSEGISGAGNAYVFNAVTGALISRLSSPDPQSGGIFGSSVAMAGGLVAVAAPGESNHEAYVYNSTGSLLLELTVPNPEGSRYGVSINENYVVVSDPLELVGGQSQSGDCLSCSMCQAVR